MVGGRHDRFNQISSYVDSKKTYPNIKFLNNDEYVDKDSDLLFKKNIGVSGIPYDIRTSVVLTPSDIDANLRPVSKFVDFEFDNNNNNYNNGVYSNIEESVNRGFNAKIIKEFIQNSPKNNLKDYNMFYNFGSNVQNLNNNSQFDDIISNVLFNMKDRVSTTYDDYTINDFGGLSSKIPISQYFDLDSYKTPTSNF
jgi:hypothetical protein